MKKKRIVGLISGFLFFSVFILYTQRNDDRGGKEWKKTKINFPLSLFFQQKPLIHNMMEIGYTQAHDIKMIHSLKDIEFNNFARKDQMYKEMIQLKYEACQVYGGGGRRCQIYYYFIIYCSKSIHRKSGLFSLRPVFSYTVYILNVILMNILRNFSSSQKNMKCQ